MLDDRNYIRIELLFNTLVVKLEFRRLMDQVPENLPEARDPKFFPSLVDIWWHLYQESRADRAQVDRTTWVRHPDYPSQSTMSNQELSTALLYIGELIDIDSLAQFRDVQEMETKLFLLTGWLAAFYQPEV